MLYYFEFISDEWVGVNIDYHMMGFILDKIPLINKMKLREVFNAKMVVGRYNDKHNSEMLLPWYSNEFSHPYYEVSVGLENIFKVLRVDAIWRLNYHNNITTEGNQVAKFGVKFVFVSDF